MPIDPKSPPAFDLQAALDTAMGDIDTLKEIGEIFDGYYRTLLSQLESSLAHGHFDQLANTAHRLKGAAVTFHADAAASSLKKLELESRGGDVETLGILVRDCQREIERLASALRELRGHSSL